MAAAPRRGATEALRAGDRLVFSLSAALLFYLFGVDLAGYCVLGALLVAATLESAFGLCLGCRAFALLIRAGVIPPEVCERCNDIWSARTPPPARVSPS